MRRRRRAPSLAKAAVSSAAPRASRRPAELRNWTPRWSRPTRFPGRLPRPAWSGAPVAVGGAEPPERGERRGPAAGTFGGVRAPPAGRGRGGCVGRRERDDAGRGPAVGRGGRAADAAVLAAGADGGAQPGADRRAVEVRAPARRGARAEGEGLRPRRGHARRAARQGRQAPGGRRRRRHRRPRRPLAGGPPEARHHRPHPLLHAPGPPDGPVVRAAPAARGSRGRPGSSAACTRTGSATRSRSTWSGRARRCTSSATRSATRRWRPRRCTSRGSGRTRRSTRCGAASGSPAKRGVMFRLARTLVGVCSPWRRARPRSSSAPTPWSRRLCRP